MGTVVKCMSLWEPLALKPPHLLIDQKVVMKTDSFSEFAG